MDHGSTRRMTTLVRRAAVRSSPRRAAASVSTTALIPSRPPRGAAWPRSGTGPPPHTLVPPGIRLCTRTEPLRKQPRLRNCDGDPFSLQLPHQLNTIHDPFRLGPRHRTTGAVTRRGERLSFRLVRSHQHVRGAAHTPRDGHRLPDRAISLRDLRVTGTKCPGGSLPVHAQRTYPSVHLVFLDLRQVVGHVVDHRHLQTLD